MRALQGIAVAVLVLGQVVGCSDDAEPKAKPTDTPSASHSDSPSPTPTAQPPTEPVAARTDKGAIAFARYFIRVLNYTAASGDTDILMRISQPTCESCQSIADLTTETYAKGGYIRGDGLTVKTQSVFKPDSRARRIVSFEVTTAPQTYRPSASEAERHGEAGTASVTVHLQPRGASWIVTKMERT